MAKNAMAKRPKTIGIIGAGRFGTGAARELLRLGHEVIVVDCDAQALELLPDACHTAIGNAESSEFLAEVGFKNVDAVIVAIGDNESASNHATINCKDFGLYVVAKALNKTHGKILDRLGADRIIFPEYDSGVRLARLLTRTAILEMVELYEEIFMMEMQAGGPVVDHTLMELNLPQRFGVQVVLIRRGKKVKFPVAASDRILDEDVLVCIGTADALTELAKRMDR
ncbi:TrkA family potassium uptake protein [Alicyclobacillus cycloheptanicus]|uniref:Trk system potassium uptake protein TrkA n=1 Tax=Alicyclobacillus cycloheptanicus TaxID=1457 RepID=A0ABT9XEP3_9BACL|nr:TrkA family potassium uptake protein [Alicyclobacillus cycloheptanicus]MDQ0188770.1 trk system potassium uptake protein TrkA [Alicyclobacillus cycloheptanicus]WDM00573.1 TrkA family potassium uptake protein [Alicyclobacillus cycloheptanicus]